MIKVKENHTDGHKFRFGVGANNRLEWVKTEVGEVAHYNGDSYQDEKRSYIRW